MAKKDTFRIVTRGSDGSLLIRDYPTCDPLLQMHLQIGTDDCSTDLALRGMPVFRGLIGPIPEGKNIVRYESPEVFVFLEFLLIEGLHIGFLARDRSGIHQAFQRAVHRAHAFAGARLHRVFDLIELSLADQVGHGRRVDEDFECGDAAGSVGRSAKLLRNDATQ